MKKLISLILTFVILLSTLTTSLATYGAVYSGMDEENIYFNNIVYHKGSLYSFINDSLFEYNDTDSNFVKIAELERTESMNGYISGLASDGDDLIYYDGSSLSFYKGAIDNGIIKLEPAYSFEKVDTGIEYFYTDKAVICDDFIYMLSFGMGQGASLYIIDKKTGQFSTKKFDENYTNIEGYKGNSIIFASGEKIKSFDGQNFTELFDIPKLDSIFGVSLVYNKAKDIILLVDENFVYSQQADGSFKKAAFTGMGFINGACAFDDNIALISDGKVYTYKLDSDNMPETFIRVYGTSTEVMRKYNEANPSLPAIAINSQYLATINDIASNMKSADACDVYVLNSSMGLKPLVERNYVVPLTMDGIKNSIDRMYPYIKEALLFDGVPYFYPIGVVSYGDISNLSNYAYSKEIFEEVGLTEEDVPKTYAQFMDFIDRYQNEISVDYPDIKFSDSMEYTDMRIMLMSRILSENAYHYFKRGEIPEYNTPLMVKLFEQLNNTDFYGFMDMSIEMDNYGSFDFMGDMDQKFLFKLRENNINIPKGYTDMPLKLDDDYEIINAANLSLLAVNSLSPNLENALKFVEFMEKNPVSIYGEGTETVMFSDKAIPVENKHALKEISRLQKNIEEMNAEIEADKLQGGKNVKALEESLTYFERALEWETQSSFIITQEEIDYYIQNLDTAYISTDAIFDFSSEQMQALFMRYIQKQIDVQNFLSELDRFVKMMSLEGI